MRDLFTQEREHLLLGLPELAEKFLSRAERKGKNWKNLVDPHAIYYHMEQALTGNSQDLTVVVNDAGTHLLMYSLGSIWWGKGTMLIEQFYCRFRSGPAGDVLGEIEALGRDIGCSAVVFATSLANDKALGRLLARQGYTQESTQHIKEL